ncbi:ammonium transporter [Pontibacter harenae]|uniref:ammonium transporter n=1 Tax=Pontibacter harenae TaxID=2894083 RepID=UPI001E5A9A8A|nr:ammonium transporter [Pontibacter harenae]MCC9165490.1 ammonium transporter [Pontibacter harenae]
MTKNLSKIPFLLLMAIVVATFFLPSVPSTTENGEINGADTAWMLTAAALVLIMTPGLAFFYGGMVNKKNVLSTMLQSFICMAVVTVIWVVFGFSLAFGDSIGGIFGDPRTFFMMNGVIDGAPWVAAPTIPLVLFAMFQLKFAIITPALITGAFAERIRFISYVLFIGLFIVFIYTPLAHATWHPDGLLFNYGVLDFAGGTVVHMSAGWAALASALYMKKRNDTNHAPAHISYVLLGTGLLWFGWFGFNAGSAMGANSLAAIALATTTTASASAAIAWVFFDAVKGRKPSAMGTCIGAVVGLVAITPAAGFVTIPHSIAIGVIASIISNLVVDWRTRTNIIDDTLDVFPCHGVGGMVGMLLTGVFANQAINGGNETGNGLIFGETTLFLVHLIALVGVSIFAFFGSLLLLKITDLITPLRVTPAEEVEGLDLSQHDETMSYEEIKKPEHAVAY